MACRAARRRPARGPRPRGCGGRRPRGGAPRRRRSGWRSTGAAACAPEPNAGMSRHPQPEPLRRRPAGQRKAPLRVRHDQRDRTRQQPLERGARALARARAAPSARRPGGTASRRRAGPGGRPLISYRRVDPRGRLGAGGQPVDGVGREQRHAPIAHAGLERRDVHGARPAVTRSRPARSTSVPASREQRAHRLGLRRRVLQREPRCRPGTGRTSARIASEPVGARDQRLARLVARDLRLKQRPLVLAHVGQVGHHEVVGRRRATR